MGSHNDNKSSNNNNNNNNNNAWTKEQDIVNVANAIRSVRHPDNAGEWNVTTKGYIESLVPVGNKVGGTSSSSRVHDNRAHMDDKNNWTSLFLDPGGIWWEYQKESFDHFLSTRHG